MPYPVPVSTFHHDVYPAIDPSNPELSQDGKVVVVTGGGQGIGSAIAQAFVTAGAAHVVLLGRTASTLEEAKTSLAGSGKSQLHTFTADVSDEKRMEEVFAEIHKSIGPIDVVVANAAYLTPFGPYAEQGTTELRQSLEVNVIGTYITSMAFFRHRNPAPSSTFISINSAAGHLPFTLPAVAYISSKAAVMRVVEMFQAEHPDLRAFSVHPGLIKSAMSQKAGLYEAANDEPALPAGLCVYLSTPKGDFVKGRLVWASWDIEELKNEWPARLEQDPGLFNLGLGGWPFDGKTAPTAFE